MDVDDLWYVPCEVKPSDYVNFKKIMREHNHEDSFLLDAEEGVFFIDNLEKKIRVVKRRQFDGDTFVERVLSKFQSDSDVMFVVKCGIAMGYSFTLETKYSN